MRWNFILSGFLFLLTGSYLDTARGVLIPVLAQVFSLNYSQSSLFLAGGNFGSILITLLLIPITQRYSEKRVALGICTLAIFTSLVASQITNFSALLFFAVALGCTVSLMGAVSNLLVIHGTDSNHRARAMCGLHTMYGYGSLLAPAIAGGILEKGYPWHLPIQIFFPVVLALGIFVFVKLPKEEPHLVRVKQSAKLSPFQIFILFSFGLYVASEVLISMWMEAFLVEHMKLSIAQSAQYVTGFFFMMGTSRFLCFFGMSEKWEKIILLGAPLLCAFFFFLGHRGFLLGFSLAGVIGPLFPIFLTRAGRIFPTQTSALTIWILTSMQISLVISHLTVGGLSDKFGIEKAYWLPGILMVFMSGVCFLFLRAERLILQNEK